MLFAMDNIEKLKVYRILAAMIDGLFMFIIFWAIFIFPLIDTINSVSNGTFSFQTTFFLTSFFILGAMLDVFYLFITSIAFKGATLGMKMNGLSFVKYDGTIPSSLTLFINALSIVIIVVFSFGLSVIVDLLSLINNKMARSFHDIFLGMKMVNTYDL